MAWFADVYGQPDGAIAVSDNSLTDDQGADLEADFQAAGARGAGEGQQQGQESTQAAAAPVQAGDDRRPDPRGQAAGESLRLLPA